MPFKEIEIDRKRVKGGRHAGWSLREIEKVDR